MNAAASLYDNMMLGLSTALTPMNLFYCFVGVTFGTFIGVLPGIGALAAISLLLPITLYLEPTAALVMLAGVYYGSNYGGSTAAILLNLPGTPSSAVACLDGYPMSRQGRAGVALLLTSVASFIGGSIGILAVMFFAPAIAHVALQFGAAEYFMMMALGLVAASTISVGSPVKGVAMVLVGLILGVVGTDINSGAMRFTFGLYQLADGISLVAISMGLFGVAEVIASVKTIRAGHVDRRAITFRSMVPTREDVRRSWLPALRGSGIGAPVGALPGAGPTIASIMAYAVEKKVSRHRSELGRGAVEGIVAPEASNNTAVQTAFIPTLTLGIPGDVVMAVIIGALLIHGIVPGPSLVVERPDMFWGLVMSFWVGNVLLLVLNIPLIGVWIRILAIPYHVLYPTILVFVAFGVYGIRYSVFDVVLVAVFGLVGYGMRLLALPPAPLLLGFVLGPMMEENLRRALLISRGSFAAFVERPISAGLLATTALLLVWTFWRAKRGGPAPDAVE